jgi:hypothetical protein
VADKRTKDDLPLILNPRNQAEKRINSILRFKERQRTKRAWINFLEIVEWLAWLAELRGRFDFTAEVHRAYEMLLRDLLDGDFGEDGRWQVRYLNPHVREQRRMTRAFLLKIIEQCTHDGCADDETVHHHLSWCWIRRRLFEKWLTKRGLPSPAWFKPQHQEQPREATQDERGESTPGYAQPSLPPPPELATHERPPLPARFEPHHLERSEVESTAPRHGPSLTPASQAVIKRTIEDVYDDADRGGPRPNINELPGAVHPRLNARGYKTSGKRIKEIGGSEEFSERRGKVGVRRTKPK